MEQGLTRNQIINALAQSSHGKLETYSEMVSGAARQDPEFLAHLISWNRVKGQVRDSKVALPILTIASKDYPDELIDNSLAHFAALDVKLKEQGARFLRTMRVPARRDRAMKRVIEASLRELESNFPKWERIALMHRNKLKSLYVLGHVKPAPTQRRILFYEADVRLKFDEKAGRKRWLPEDGASKHEDYPRGSLFDVVSRLSKMSPSEAAGTILEKRIPSLIATGALSAAALSDPTVLMALTQTMSATEVVTRAKSISKKGAKTDPVVRAALNKALVRASESSKNVLKTTRAAEALEEDGESELAARLRAVQEKQIERIKSLDGDWLVLADKSSSMSAAIELATRVAATLAKFVKGTVSLVFFDSGPTYVDATGKTYEEILARTKFIIARGSTSIGCGLRYAMEKKLPIDGVAIVSDAQENTAPFYAQVFEEFARKLGHDVPTYLYRVDPGSRGHSDRDLKTSMGLVGKDVQEFDLRGAIDYYSLPNLVQTMRVNRYSLMDEIMDAPLLKLEDVLGMKLVAA